MRYLLLIPILALALMPSKAVAITGQDVEFLPGLGVPELMADTTASCNNQARVLYMPGMGIPEAVFDTTATCASAGGGGGGTNKQDVIWFE